jgi:hypothetical protein
MSPALQDALKQFTDAALRKEKARGVLNTRFGLSDANIATMHMAAIGSRPLATRKPLQMGMDDRLACKILKAAAKLSPQRGR